MRMYWALHCCMKCLRNLIFCFSQYIVALCIICVFLKRVKAGTLEGACSRSMLLQQAPRAKLPRLHQRFLTKKYVCATKLFAPEFCSLISNWFDMREQAPGANLLLDSVSGASSLVCTEICFAGACFRSKLPRGYWNLLCGSVFQERVFRSKLLRGYWLEYLPGSMFREHVSGASSLVCTGLYVLVHFTFWLGDAKDDAKLKEVCFHKICHSVDSFNNKMWVVLVLSCDFFRLYSLAEIATYCTNQFCTVLELYVWKLVLLGSVGECRNVIKTGSKTLSCHCKR